MRIIFSRKGFDGSAGGYPSPIVDGRPLSFPIPSSDARDATYSSLLNGVGDFLYALTSINPELNCHLDPDIDERARPRAYGWRGAFGQAGGAQGHLQKHGVCVGDIFLFWGWFRNARKNDSGWTYTGDHEHRIFGWLQIGDILRVGSDPSAAVAAYPWLREHPHASAPGSWNSNTIYVASSSLQFNGKRLQLPGWGTFSKGWRLTMNGCPRSHWAVPDWLNPKRGGVGMSWSCKPESNRWHRDGYLRVGPGQEFIANLGQSEELNEKAGAWLQEMFSAAGGAANVS